MAYRFSESKVEYASHQLSLYYGKCPHQCSYCFINYLYRKRKIPWSMGELRRNQKAIQIAKQANADKVDCLVVSFVNDPLPRLHPHRFLSEIARSDMFYCRLNYLIEILDILNKRKINTKVLTKNSDIYEIALTRDPYEYITLGCSITTNGYNDSVRKYFEPNTSTIKGRFSALDILKEHGFKTWVSMEPILPKTNILGLITSLISREVDEIWVGKNNYDPELTNVYDWKRLCKTLLKHQPIFSPKLHIKSELLKAGGFWNVNGVVVKYKSKWRDSE